MTIFRKSFNVDKKDAFNFMLICVNDFSNYIMVNLIKDKKASTVPDSMIKIIQREKAIPIIVHCYQGTEIKNKLFNDPKTNGFRIQFTSDRRKAVDAECAIRTICRTLEQYYIIQPNDKLETAVQRVVCSHNTASRRNPMFDDGTHASPLDVVTNPNLIDPMEKTLHNRRLDQYTTNSDKKVIRTKLKFKQGDLVWYMLRKSKFSKESSLRGSWSEKIYSIYGVNKAHSFKLVHTYVLSELGTNFPFPDLPPIQENLRKTALVTNRDTFAIEKILQKRGNHILVKCLWKDLNDTSIQVSSLHLTSPFHRPDDYFRL